MKHANRAGKVLGLALGTALLAWSVALPAFAALGGDAASVEADVAKMKGQSRATPAAGYTVSELTLPTGTVVHEYISVEGKVFAVTWKGPAVPDLAQTLGTYFNTMKAATSVPHGADHHHLTVTTSDLVLQTGGHMRAYFGKAYVPSLLPPNFVLDEIK
jgi:Protein of unknown function (DUF2844)